MYWTQKKSEKKLAGGEKVDQKTQEKRKKIFIEA
jgi:hypothetical protein